MRITLKDKAGQLYALNSHDHRVQARGGRGRKVFFPKGALVVVGRLHLQLLPGQSMAVTCPGCQEARVFEGAGSHYINYHCAKCVAV